MKKTGMSNEAQDYKLALIAAGTCDITEGIEVLTVPNNIPIPFLRVQLHRESSNIAHGIRGSPGALYGAKADEDRSSTRRIRQHLCESKLLRRF